jgi:hypothetical protein
LSVGSLASNEKRKIESTRPYYYRGKEEWVCGLLSIKVKYLLRRRKNVFLARKKVFDSMVSEDGTHFGKLLGC